jgi:hypothetical protein
MVLALGLQKEKGQIGPNGTSSQKLIKKCL